MYQAPMEEAVTWFDEEPREVDGHRPERGIQLWLHPSPGQEYQELTDIGHSSGHWDGG